MARSFLREMWQKKNIVVNKYVKIDVENKKDIFYAIFLHRKLCKFAKTINNHLWLQIYLAVMYG